MSVRIVDVREITKPISSPIRNAYIDFTKMTTSLVAVVTDAVRDGKRVVGYGFNSNGRYGQGGLIRERLRRASRRPIPKHCSMLTAPISIRTRLGNPDVEREARRPWRTLGRGRHHRHGVWDAVAKIAGQPLFRLLAARHGLEPDPRVFVYAAGGYYYPARICRRCAAKCAAISIAATTSSR